MTTKRTKNLKYKKREPNPAREEYLRELFHQNECKLQFVLWSDWNSLDVSGIYEGEPVFRPAICAWEAWKAAWQHLSDNV